MDLSVVIPCHGGVEDTRECLRSLAEQRAAPAMEVLVVDNASPDETGSLDREFPGVRVLPQPRNLGFAGGVNAGLRAARGLWLMILNNDTRAAPHLVRRLLDALRHDGRIGMAGPVSNFVKGLARLPVGDLGEDRRGRQDLEAELTAVWGNRLQDVETLAGLCLLFHRRLLDQIGFLDSRFGRGNFEDDDFCLRARLRGHRLVVVPDAFLHHRGGATFRSLGLDYRRELRDREAVFRDKWRGDAAGDAYLAGIDGDLEAAAKASRRALALRPAWPDALLHLARHAAATGSRGEAIGHLRDFLTTCPLHAEAIVRLATLTLAEGDLPRSSRLLDWALRHCPLDRSQGADVLEHLGRWNLEAGRHGAAAAAFTDAAGLQPDRPSVHNLLGVARLEAGDLAGAVPPLTRAATLGSAEAETNLGICCWRAGQPVAALRHFAAAMERSPGCAAARTNLRAALAAIDPRTGPPAGAGSGLARQAEAHAVQDIVDEVLEGRGGPVADR